MNKHITRTSLGLMVALSLASNAFASSNGNNKNYVTQPQLAAESKAGSAADAKLQSQITQQGYEINTQAKYTTSVKESLEAAVATQGAINGQLSSGITAAQGAAQIANEKGDAGAVRMDGIESSLANTDNRSINNAVRLDGVEAGVAKLDSKVEGYAANGQQQLNDVKAAGAAAISAQAKVNTNVQGQLNAGGAAIGALNGRVDDVNGKAVNAQNTADVAVGLGQKGINDAYNAQQTANTAVGMGQQNGNDIVNLQNTQGQHSTTLNQHTNQIATITDVNAAQQTQINTNTTTNNRQDTQISNLQSYASDMDQRLGGRLDSQQSQINDLKRDTKQAKEAAAGALAVAGHQFSTDKSAGFQAALSAATIGGKQAIAIGAGGAITEKFFVNAAFTQSGSTTGGVVSGTYRLQ